MQQHIRSCVILARAATGTDIPPEGGGSGEPSPCRPEPVQRACSMVYSGPTVLNGPCAVGLCTRPARSTLDSAGLFASRVQVA